MREAMRLSLVVATSAILVPLLAHAQVVQPATPVDRPAPDYPDAAGDSEGYVKLRFTVDKTGHVTDVQPFESSPQGLFDATAVEAMSHWSYRPRTVDGKPADQPGNTIVLRFKPGADRPPIWLNPSPAYYPREAYEAKAEGMVKVGYEIDERGMVGNVHLVSSSVPGVFDQAALDNVKNRVFRPMMVNGKPTADGGLVATLDYKLADAKIEPKPLHKVFPKYPQDAESHNVQGYCAVAYTIAPDGSVTDPTVTTSFPSGVFDKASLDALKKWQFEPAETLHGPAASQGHLAFSYRMSGVPDWDVHYLEKGQWVKLDYTLEADGHTGGITVIDQSEPSLPVSKAIDQLKKTRFNPVIENGAPVGKAHQVIIIN
jgi:TonB family protein